MIYESYIVGGVLYHHGIKGQQWGKRNGPPYPLSKDVSTGKRLKVDEHGGLKDIMLKRTEKKAKKLEEKMNKEKKPLPTKIKDADLLSEENMNKSKNKDRTDKAAELGLKALNDSDRYQYETFDPKNEDDKWWFLYEDQTIGLPLIADMVRQGYSKKQIYDMIDEADNSWYDNYEDAPNGYFELSNNVYSKKQGYLDGYVDACIKIKKKEDAEANKKSNEIARKQNQIFNNNVNMVNEINRINEINRTNQQFMDNTWQFMNTTNNMMMFGQKKKKRR